MRTDELDTAQPVVQLVKVSKQQNDSIEAAARLFVWRPSYAATASRARRNRLAISRAIAGCAPNGSATASAPLLRRRS